MSNSVGPLSTQAGLELLQASLPSNLPRDQGARLPQALPQDPAKAVGANPNNVITRNDERIQQETQKSGTTQAQTLDLTT
jgi:hypothetical protein